jgi:heptaprenyl diphosphate synthase
MAGSNDVRASRDPVTAAREELLGEDLCLFYETLFETLKAQKDYLTDTEYNMYRQGKKIRPVLLLLTSRMLHGIEEPLPYKAIQGAVSLEMLHVATLIHDDIVDNALVRRGMPSVNAQRGAGVSVIVGDLQFVQAIRGFVDTIDAQHDLALIKLVLDTAFKICCGELDELQTDPSLDTAALTEQYMRTADRKTAVLFGLACESGASLVASHTSDARRAGFFGRRLGMAFQIMDDLLDFAQTDETAGKAKGTDLVQRRLSLPIIYAMDELGPDHMVSRIMAGYEADRAEIADCISAIQASSSFYRAYAEARQAALEAIEFLRPFPDNRFRHALQEIAMHVVDRI